MEQINMEDKELYNKFLNGDETSFETIIKKYKTSLIYFINKYVKNLDSAEDIFQDTIIYILEHKDMYNFDYSFKSFLYTIAKSRSLDYLKHEKIIEHIDEKDFNDEQSLEEKVFAKFEYEEIRNLIDKLPEDYQMAIYLSQIEGFSYSETAKLMNKNEKQIKFLVHRARKKLKEAVKSEHHYTRQTKIAMIKRLSFKEGGIEVKQTSMFKILLIILFITILSSGLVYAAIQISKNYTGKAKMTPTYTSQISTMDTNKVWVGTFNLVWNDFMDDVVKGKIEFEDGESALANELNKQTFKANQLSDNSYFKIHGASYGTDLKSKIENGIKTKFNEESKIIDKVDWNDSNGYVLYAMLKKEFNYLEPFSTAMGTMEFNGEDTRVKCFGVDSSNNPIAGKNVEVLFYNSENDFAIKLKTKEGEEVILYKTTGEGKSFEENYQEIINNQNKFNGNNKFEENDILRIPFIQVHDEINYDEICGREIKDTNGIYIKQALQTIDFDLNNVGGSVKSEAVINATQKVSNEKIRKMIFDSDFILYLKEENKEQPYFALKVDDTEVLLQEESE